MVEEDFKKNINELKNKKLIFEALDEVLSFFELNHSLFKRFVFREELNPKGLLLTAEGDEQNGFTIHVPQNILDFDLDLISNLLMHEVIHLYQRSGDNKISEREEREWQAYTEMIFHRIFPKVPDLSNFYIKQFGEKAITYYNKMSPALKEKYVIERNSLEELLQIIYNKEMEIKEENTITWSDFEKIDIRVGTIISVEDFPKARNPAYILQIDFGELGIKKTSAQITSLYTKEELLDKQIISVVNFPKKQIATFMSECLVMGVYGDHKDVVLLHPERKVKNGSKIG